MNPSARSLTTPFCNHHIGAQVMRILLAREYGKDIAVVSRTREQVPGAKAYGFGDGRGGRRHDVIALLDKLKTGQELEWFEYFGCCLAPGGVILR